VDYVHLKESSRGRDRSGLSGYCLSLGRSNEYGFDPYTPRCFKDQQEATQTVSKWFEERLAYMSPREALCYYNQGIRTQGCVYASGF
jgi:hypothetical protein